MSKALLHKIIFCFIIYYSFGCTSKEYLNTLNVDNEKIIKIAIDAIKKADENIDTSKLIIEKIIYAKHINDIHFTQNEKEYLNIYFVIKDSIKVEDKSQDNVNIKFSHDNYIVQIPKFGTSEDIDILYPNPNGSQVIIDITEDEDNENAKKKQKQGYAPIPND